MFSDLLAFPDCDDPTLKSSSQSQGAFKQVVHLIFFFFFFPKSCPRDLKPDDPASVVW